MEEGGSLEDQQDAEPAPDLEIDAPSDDEPKLDNTPNH
jgi:hypothetical protein